MRRVRIVAGAVLLAAGAGLWAAPQASAAHCTDNGGAGNSDFADHVRANNGPGGHDEGDHQGWSSCVPQASSGGR